MFRYCTDPSALTRASLLDEFDVGYRRDRVLVEVEGEAFDRREDHRWGDEPFQGGLHHLGEATLIISGFAETANGQGWRCSADQTFGRQLPDTASINQWLEDLRGSFHGMFRISPGRKFHLFASRCGIDPLVYRIVCGQLVVTDHLLEAARLSRHFAVSPKIEPESAIAYLGQGGMVDDRTLIADTYRVMPGTSVKIDLDASSRVVHRWFEVEKYGGGPPSTVLNEVIGSLDSAFEQGIKRQHKWSGGQETTHVGSLSGGLDSRMVVLAATELGFDDRINVTFGDPGCDDHRIAEEITRDLEQDGIAVNLSGGEYLDRIFDVACIANGGLTAAVSAMHVTYTISLLSLGHFPAFHTGQMGDAVLGSFLKGIEHTPPDVTVGGVSKLLGDLCEDLRRRGADAYPSHEAYLFETRGLMTANGGLMQVRPWVRCLTPFLDEDFLDIVLNIPASQRYGNALYRSWINLCRPKANKFRWEKTGSKPNAPRIAGMTRSEVQKKLTRRWSSVLAGSTGRQMRGMNPYDRWFANNPRLRQLTRQYCLDNRHRLRESLSPKTADELLSKELNAFESLHLRAFLKTVSLIEDVC